MRCFFVCLFVFANQSDCPAGSLTAPLTHSFRALENNTHSVTARRRMNGGVVRAARSSRPRCPSAAETEPDKQDEGSEGGSCQSQQRFSAFLAAALHLRHLRYHAVCLLVCLFVLDRLIALFCTTTVGYLSCILH